MSGKRQLRAVDPSRRAPAHLSAAMRRWWTTVDTDWRLDDHHRCLLTLACEAWDRSEQARMVVAADGLVVDGRFGKRPNPAVIIERDAKLVFSRLVRQLHLEEPVVPAPLGGARRRV